MNKRGFTLIELLAVIVILAIIALIATPIILNMINNARKSSAKSSALGYIDAIEYNNGFAQIQPDKYTLVTGEDIDVSGINVKAKGKKPDSGKVTVNDKGKVTSAELCINGYKAIYDGKDVTSVTKGCSASSNNNNNNNQEPEQQEQTSFGGQIDKTKQYSSSSVEQEGLIGVAYLDPTDLEASCTSSTAVSTTGTKTGCMKFYIFDDSGSTYKLILDHNTTAIGKGVSTDTTGWEGNPRLIEADEVAHIIGVDTTATLQWSQSKPYGTDVATQSSWFFFDATGTTYSNSNGWQKSLATTQGSSKYAWLYDYTRDCASTGCSYIDSSTRGYWTKTGVNGLSNSSWVVYNGGMGNYDNSSVSSIFGVRPVIEIEKSKLQ